MLLLLGDLFDFAVAVEEWLDSVGAPLTLYIRTKLGFWVDSICKLSIKK